MRWVLIFCTGLLGGCFLFSRPAENAATSASTSSSEEMVGPIELAERGELGRAGVVARGDYLFEISNPTGGIERRIARLDRFDADELEISLDGSRQTFTRETTWPLLCLKVPVRFGDGARRIELRAGAPVYVIAANRTEVRIGPVPVVGHGRVIERAQLSLEGCDDAVSDVTEAHVADTESGDTACLFADTQPIDETEGLPIPSRARLAVLERGGEWTRVRVQRAGGSLEGWMSSSLVASGSAPANPDWIASALRPERCHYPDRPARLETSRAWAERSADDLPAPSIAPFEAVLNESEPRVRACYDELPIEERPSRVAYVEIRLEVDGDGQVATAAVTRRENAPESLARCMAERARRIRFPSPRTGIVLRRTYAFDPPPRPNDEGIGDLEEGL